MNTVLSAELVRLQVHEQRVAAAAEVRAARLRSARRWQRKAEHATHRARLARLAIQ